MEITSRGRFAVDALIELALHHRTKPVALPDLSVRFSVSLSYSEQIFRRLRDKGIVESARGPNGGYTLARPLECLSVADILHAVSEPDPMKQRCAEKAAANGTSCMTELWNDVDALVENYFESVSLHDLIANIDRRRLHATH